MFDINEPPTDINISNYTVAENADSGTIVGKLNVKDPDSGQTHSCVLLDDAQNTFALINDILQVKQNKLLDFERSNKLSVLIQCDDSGFPKQSLKKQISIFINDVNEQPTSISISKTTVAENAVNEFVGTLQTSDPDAKDNIFIYKLMKGEDYFMLKKGKQLFTKVDLNYEKKNSYQIEIRSTDSEGKDTMIILRKPLLNCREDILQVFSFTINKIKNINFFNIFQDFGYPVTLPLALLTEMIHRPI